MPRETQAFVTSYVGLLEEMENAAAFEQPQTHTGTGVVVEKRERLEPGFVAAAYVESEHPRDPGGEDGGKWIAKGTSAEGGSEVEPKERYYHGTGRGGVVLKAGDKTLDESGILYVAHERKVAEHYADRHLDSKVREFVPVKGVRVWKPSLEAIDYTPEKLGAEVRKAKAAGYDAVEFADATAVFDPKKLVPADDRPHLVAAAEAEELNDRVAAGWAKALPLEERLAAKYEQAGRGLARRARRRYEGAQPVIAAARPPNWLPQPDELVTEEDAAAAAARTQAARRAIVQAMVGSILGVEASRDAVFRALIEAQAGRQAERLVEGSRDAVARVILDAQVDGWGVPETAQQIQTELEAVSRWQSVMLARTDLISLSNASSVASASLLGADAPPYKVWLATSDDRTRPDHHEAEGQTVPIDQSFTVGGESLAYPGDPNGSDGNVINCRCTVRYAWQPNPGFAPNAISASFSPSQPRYQLGVREGGRWRPESGEGTLDDLAARHPDVEVWVSDHGDGITLHMIRTKPGARGTGAASRALRDLTAMADRRGVPVWLTPEAMGDDAPMSTDQLARWYRRHGWADANEQGLMRRDPAITAATVTEEDEMAELTAAERDWLAQECIALVNRARQLKLTESEPITADGEPEGLDEAVTASAEPGFPEGAYYFTAPSEPGDYRMLFNAQTGTTTFTSVVASAPVAPPEEWFEDPGLTEPTPLTVTPEGRVFGHLAQWGRCHTGIGGRCVIAPRSQTGYEAFHTGSVLTDGGKQVRIGKITARGPHADLNMSGMQAASHYDHSAMSAAYVRAGEDEHGPWLAGAVRSDATPEQIAELRAHPPSGDWRQVGPGGALELVAALAVPVPGFPVAAIAASGAHEGEVTALIMGFDDRQPLALAASCGCDELEQLLEDGALAGLPEREVRMRTLRAV